MGNRTTRLRRDASVWTRTRLSHVGVNNFLFFEMTRLKPRNCPLRNHRILNNLNSVDNRKIEMLKKCTYLHRHGNTLRTLAKLPHIPISWNLVFWRRWNKVGCAQLFEFATPLSMARQGSHLLTAPRLLPGPLHLGYGCGPLSRGK
jgi:hypothetical protein